MAKKSTKNKIIKEVKKVHKLTLVLVVVFALLGIGAGFGTTYLLTRNDVFEVIGGTEITINVNEQYIEQGARAIAFGKDISASVVADGTVDTSVEGKYVVTYTVNHFRFSGYKLYKLVTVVSLEV